MKNVVIGICVLALLVISASANAWCSRRDTFGWWDFNFIDAEGIGNCEVYFQSNGSNATGSIDRFNKAGQTHRRLP